MVQEHFERTLSCFRGVSKSGGHLGGAVGLGGDVSDGVLGWTWGCTEGFVGQVWPVRMWMGQTLPWEEALAFGGGGLLGHTSWRGRADPSGSLKAQQSDHLTEVWGSTLHLDMEIVCFSREMLRDEPRAEEECRGEMQRTRGESVYGVAGKEQLVPHCPLWPLIAPLDLQAPLPSTFRSCICPGPWGQGWPREQTLGLRVHRGLGCQGPIGDVVVEGD